MDKRPFRTTRRPQNYAQSRPGWYTIKAQASGPARIDIYDEIGFMAVSAQSFITDLANLDCAADVEMHLNSPGGDVFDGIAIYNALKQRQGQVSVVVDGLAASAASFIAQAASPGQLSMAPHSQMMIHDAFGMAIGNASDMQEMASLLDKASDNIAGIYADRTGKPADYWREQMRNETWLSDQEAVAAGLADKIHGQEAPSSDWDLSVFAKYAGVQPAGPPADLRVPAMTNSASVVVNADGNHAPMTGTHKHSHPAYGAQGTDSVHSHEHEHEGDANHGHHKQAAAPDEGTSAAAVVISAYCRPCGLTAGADARFCNSCGTRLSMADESGWVQDPDGTWRFDPDGDGDDDSTPEGDTDHDYWDADGNQIKEIPPCPGRVGDFLHRQLLNADVDSSPWDASKAWHNGSEADDPAAFYKAICAGRRAGDPDTQDAWALPYKYTPSSSPNAAGVRNALARISSTQGLTNKDEAQSLLEGLMKKINPDYDPGDRIDPGLLAQVFAIGLEG